MLGVIRGFDKLVKKLAECRKQRDDFRTKYLDLLAWKKPTYDYAKELKELDDKIKKRKKHLEAVDRSIAEKNEECKNLKARKETKEKLVNKEKLVHKAHKANKVHKETKVTKVTKVTKAILEKLVHKVHKAHLIHLIYHQLHLLVHIMT